MNNIVTNNLKRYSNYPSGVAKQTSNEAKKKRSAFYDDFVERTNQYQQELMNKVKTSTHNLVLNLRNNPYSQLRRFCGNLLLQEVKLRRI